MSIMIFAQVNNIKDNTVTKYLREMWQFPLYFNNIKHYNAEMMLSNETNGNNI